MMPLDRCRISRAPLSIGITLQKNNEMPAINDVAGWAKFMQNNPLPKRLDANPAVIYRLLKKAKPRELIDAHIAFKTLRRPKEQLYLSCAVYFAIASTVNKNLFKSFKYDREDFKNDRTGDLYHIADDSDHQDHQALRKFFPFVVRNRVIDAIEKLKRTNPIIASIDIPQIDKNENENPKTLNTEFDMVSTDPGALLLLMAQDSLKLMPPRARQSFENLINGEEDDENIDQRSRYRNRAEARNIFRSEIEEGFVMAFDDDDDDITTTNAPDPRDVCLLAFHFAYPDNPSEADVTKWCEAFPQYAESIREHAAIARTLPAEGEGPELTEEDVLHLLETFEKKYA